MLVNPTAQAIQRHRIRLGLSPEQFGQKIGCAGMTVRRVEAGYTPFRSTQAKFARELGREVDELFAASDNWKINVDATPA